MWEPRDFDHLPGWVKNAGHYTNFKISRSLVKKFYGKNYTYKILYTRDRHGRIHTRCWRRLNKRPQYYSYRSNRALVGVLVGIICLIGLAILFTQPNLFSLNKVKAPILPAPTPIPTIRSPDVSVTNIEKYTGVLKVGNIATNSSGLEGVAILSNNFNGQYFVKQVFLDKSTKGWHTDGPQEPYWLSYLEVEKRFPVTWKGGIMDVNHIPDRDWSLPEYHRSSSGLQIMTTTPTMTTSPTIDSISHTLPPIFTITQNPASNPPNVDAGAIEQVTLSLLNLERAKRNLTPLKWNSAAAIAAKDHSRYMVKMGIMDHNLPGEPDAITRIKTKVPSSSYIFENIGGVCGLSSVDGVTNQIMHWWMWDDASWDWGHRHTILDGIKSDPGFNDKPYDQSTNPYGYHSFGLNQVGIGADYGTITYNGTTCTGWVITTDFVKV